MMGSVGMNSIDEGALSDIRQELKRGLKFGVGVNGAAIILDGIGQ